jgi:hypothetical protein
MQPAKLVLGWQLETQDVFAYYNDDTEEIENILLNDPELAPGVFLVGRGPYPGGTPLWDYQFAISLLRPDENTIKLRELQNVPRVLVERGWNIYRSFSSLMYEDEHNTTPIRVFVLE